MKSNPVWNWFMVLALACTTIAAHADVFQDAAKGDAAAVTACLDGGGDVNAADQVGATLLHYAAAENRVEIIALLLQWNANVNARKRDGVTPLHVAAGQGHAQAVKMLLGAGADAHARDRWGRTPLSLAVARDYPEVVAALQAAPVRRALESASAPDTAGNRAGSPN